MLTWLVCGVLAAAQGASVPASGSGRAFEVPYRLSDTQHIVVRAKLNGKGPYHFVVDTGAPALILSEAVGAEVGARNGPGGWAELRSVEIEGGPVLRNVRSRVDDPFQLKTMNQTGLSEGRLAGVLADKHLAPEGLVVFRHDARDALALPPLKVADVRTYGSMAVEFLRRQ